MFIGCFNELLEKGVELSELVSSNVFRFQFDYDEWPSTHHDFTTYYRPYNGSIFDIRNHYRTVFNDKQFEIPEEDEVEEGAESGKVYKITYILNTLSQLSEFCKIDDSIGGSGVLELENPDVSLLSLVSVSDEQELFVTDGIDELITFKW